MTAIPLSKVHEIHSDININACNIIREVAHGVMDLGYSVIIKTNILASKPISWDRGMNEIEIQVKSKTDTIVAYFCVEQFYKRRSGSTIAVDDVTLAKVPIDFVECNNAKEAIDHIHKQLGQDN